MASTLCALQLEDSRKRSGVSLEQISESTKISTRFLRAIECEEFDKLPGGVFNTSYIRQYAAAISFDEAGLLAFYHAKVAAAEAEAAANSPQAKLRPSRSWRSLLGIPSPSEPF